MKRRPLTSAAAVAAAILVTASAASASAAADAATQPGVRHPAPVVHHVNLHTRFERALSKARRSYREAGIVPARDKRGRALSVACSGCNVSWQGGPVQHSPHVYILLWGPNWTGSDPGFDDVYWMFDSLGQSNDGWSTTTSQYCDSSGCPTFTGSVLQGAWQDSSTPPNPVTSSDLAAEANGLASDLGISDTGDAQIVVMSQSGTCFSDGFAGSCGSPGSGGYCGWHSYSGTVSYTNLPYQLDAQGECGENWINSGSAGTYDGFSTVGGHEFAESVTDPQLNAWWDTTDGSEIADKCAWASPNGDVSLTDGTFAMQSLWSNNAGSCVM